MVNSKNKGNSFEREIAKLLSRVTKKKWIRVPTSGAFAQHSEQNIFKGDVFCDNEDFNVVIECKSYKNLNFTDLFKKKSTFWNWIKQAQLESDKYMWILFFKINNQGTYMVYKDRNYITGLLESKNKITINEYKVCKVQI